MVHILICGGGNGAHVYAGVAASQPEVTSSVLTMYADEAQRWNATLADFTVKIHHQNGAHKLLKDKPLKISKNPEEAVPECDIIVLVVPAFAHKQYLTAIKPHVKPGTILVGLPGQPGFEFEVCGIMGELAKQCTIMSYESLPWACRIIEFGKNVDLLSTKGTLSGSVHLGSVTPGGGDPTALLQKTLGPQPILNTMGHLLGVTLMSPNAYMHPTMMYGQWHNWDGQPVNEPPLFHHGMTQDTAALASSLSDEVLNIAKAITTLHPKVDLTNVIHVYEWFLKSYGNEIKDKKNLYTCIHTNPGYHGLTHPCEKTEDRKFIPNFNYRYLSEDIPYGLAVIKGVAVLANVPTPNTDKVLIWSQERLGQEYLVNGKFVGMDIKGSRAPQRYGFHSLVELLKD